MHGHYESSPRSLNTYEENKSGVTRDAKDGHGPHETSIIISQVIRQKKKLKKKHSWQEQTSSSCHVFVSSIDPSKQENTRETRGARRKKQIWFVGQAPGSQERPDDSALVPVMTART